MPDTVVLADADLPALVAASLACVHREGAVALLDAASSSPAAAAVKAHAELFGAETLGPLPPGADTSTALLAGARSAAAAGATRLIWPVAVNAELDLMCREADRALLITRLIALDAELGPAAAARFEIQTPLLDLSDAQVAELAIDLDVPVWRCWWWPVVGGVPLTCSEVSASRPGSPFEPPALEAAKALAQRWTTALRAVGWAEDIELASIT